MYAVQFSIMIYGYKMSKNTHTGQRLSNISFNYLVFVHLF